MLETLRFESPRACTSPPQYTCHIKVSLVTAYSLVRRYYSQRKVIDTLRAHQPMQPPPQELHDSMQVLHSFQSFRDIVDHDHRILLCMAAYERDYTSALHALLHLRKAKLSISTSTQ